MKNNLEYRVGGRELRVVNNDGKRTLAGYAAVYDSLSDDLGGFVERIAPGAFDQSLKDHPDVFSLFNHNWDQVLGRTTAGTLDVSTDKTGLKFSVTLPDTDYGNNLAVSVERGDITGCSFGFCVPSDGDAWTTQADGRALRTLNQVELFEITVTPCPAYPETSVALRSAKRALGGSFPCLCPCGQCKAGACNICSEQDCRWLGCRCAERSAKSGMETRDDKEAKTMRVDGEDLTADCFLIVLDPEKTDTWNLPVKFSTDEKTKSHLRDALARFDQLKDVPQDVKDKAWKRLLELCKEHGIDISDEDKERSAANRLRELRLRMKLAQHRARVRG
jgi:HK97 family phage prohead protease